MSIELKDIKTNPDNPREIKENKFDQLKKSIKEFPEMMELRPIIIDDDNVVLGGNMRLRALKELGYKEVDDKWVKKASELTEEQKKEFIIKDNQPYGEWDIDKLANEWGVDDLLDWGFDEEQLAIGSEFEPVGIDEQGKLDERKKVICPNCREEFEPK